jgi:16S rRNA (uracil1498-N3)-methyltransferase
MTIEGHAASFTAAVAHAFVSDLSSTVTIEGADGHHFARVRRLRSGEIITLSDGNGKWRAYEIRSVDAALVGVVAASEVHVEPASFPPIGIAPALIAKNRFDDMVVAAVELGVDAIYPFAAHRCVVQWRGAKALAARERMHTLVREASMQCRRSRLVAVHPVADAKALAAVDGIVIAAVDGVGVDELAAARTAVNRWVVVSGPEGGLDSVDLAALECEGPVPRLRLGPHIMRAETAPLAAIAAINTIRQ